MITIKNKQAIRKMYTAGQLLVEIFDKIDPLIQPGVSTQELDAWITRQLVEKGLTSECKGYAGYQHVSCISLNDEVVHGIPSQQVLAAGDLVKIDVCASWKGYCADLARCFFVGEGSEKMKQLVAVAQSSLDKGIEQARSGNHLSDISAAVQQEVEKHGFGVVRDFAGHGIGKKMHEAPEILNYGKPGEGPVLRVGMALAIEPMITAGDYRVYITDDGWTVRTVDGSWAAHVEDTVVILENGPYILTRNGQELYI
jgi:methionyl aminopeptidase